MKPGRRERSFLLLLTAGLLVSIALNSCLFRTCKKYYLQLNTIRLDPLGLRYFPNAFNQRQQGDQGKVTAVFFGDSRADQWPMPDLQDFLFLNRGIGSQTSSQIVRRYEQHVRGLNPDILIVQAGINDLKTIPLFPERKTEIIADCKDNIRHIVRQGREQGATVVLNTIFPVGPVPLQRKIFWSDEVGKAVNEVNEYIRSLAGRRVVVFDAFAVLADQRGMVRPEYGFDELHLNSSGYAALNRQLIPLLKSLSGQKPHHE